MTDYFTVNGSRLEVAWAGTPRADGVAIVLLHEGLGSVALWRDFPDALAERTGLPVLTYSRAGYGWSDPVTFPRPLTYLDHEAEVILPGMLDAAGIARAVLVSMAAHVFLEEITLAGLEVARDAYENRNLRSRLARWHGANVDCAFYGWNETWLDPAFRDWNMEHRLPHVTAPALIVQGEDDEYGTPAQVEAIAVGVSGPVETWMIPDCGHAPYQDARNAVLDRIAAFALRVIT